MSQTVVGIFENTNPAQEAKAYLIANGFDSERVDINTNANQSGYGTSEENNRESEDWGDKISNFFTHLFDDEDEAANHTEAARRGTTVTVHARSQDEALKAAEVLDNFGAVDVDEFAGRGSNRANNLENDVTVPVIEEELQVGKREVETGGVRLRSRVIERPVEETIRLREEHINIVRNPVDREATSSDFERAEENTIEVTEHAEIPVVNKEARVVEEVSLDKEVTEREETINETVRNTEIDTEELSDQERSYHHDYDSNKR